MLCLCLVAARVIIEALFPLLSVIHFRFIDIIRPETLFKGIVGTSMNAARRCLKDNSGILVDARLGSTHMGADVATIKLVRFPAPTVDTQVKRRRRRRVLAGLFCGLSGQGATSGNLYGSTVTLTGEAVILSLLLQNSHHHSRGSL